MQMQTVVDSSSDEVGIKARCVVNLRQQIHQAGVQATQEVFEQQILPAARSLSPKLTGKNAASTGVSFRDKPETGWISAWISTHSGYGWLIEHGTSSKQFRPMTKTAIKKRKGWVAPLDRTPPRPYIYPAMMRYVGGIAERQRQILEASK